MKLWHRVATLLAISVGLAGAPTAFAQTPAPGASQNTKGLVLKDDARCTTCHDESDAPELLAIGKTRHGTAADARTPTCTSCHGESDKHVDYKGAGDPPRPDIVFGAKSNVSATTRSEACLTCHKGGNNMFWDGGKHAGNDVTCTSCHSVHQQEDKVRNKRTETEVCYACHKEQRAQMNRVSRHPVPEGKMGCSSCHNPHNSTGPKQLIKDSVNETCYTCHMEKRGPFAWEHQPVTDDCSNCHSPHGTTAPNLLKARQPFLCQQCHEPTNHRGNAPGLNPIGSYYPGGQNITAARGCANCHTNVHGSNSPNNGRLLRN